MATASAAANNSTFNQGTRRRLRIWGMGCVLFMCWAAYTFIGQWNEHKAMETKLSTVQKQLEEASVETKQLQLQIDRLNDPEYIEQLATKEQGMVKDGQQPIQVIK
ncbi:septum formation initiator family protein [Paenibacillus sp. NEAU-GSW1]|uniref:FtsB family cell division protein n=1 Tax=Paenibacillus sp. NEAU-GSW1 TaxID=2682486 RepID=UPI0012E1DA26|nr:septum formation initiator family protein [Paenibacillus sp. NEAU-GSW1]MUT67686.1 septum formation initiator family protein [Paenibacillus sp. NEAU-GSW1]